MILSAVICVIFMFNFGHGILDSPNVAITDHPYQVTIEYNKMYRCTGAIIKPDWILTAAQCITNVTIENMRVRGGTNRRSIMGQVHDVQYVTVHEGYNQELLDYDLGLIKLTDPFTFSGDINNISVATDIPLYGTLVTLTGWGSPRPGTWMSEYLQRIDIPLVYWRECQYDYMQVERPVTQSMFCAGNEGDGICGGDTGDPLTYNNQLIGIMSWSFGCGEKRFSAVFTAAHNLTDWINSRTN